jgi:photosystem II stability/assembly factor-like uncharacterized protein
MKHKFTLGSVFLLLCILTQGQTWTPQASGFSAASRGIHYLHAVDSNVVWATGYDGVTTTNQIQEFTRTTNGGTTWTAGAINGVSGYGISMICAIDALTAWVPAWGPAGGGKILKTTDGGLNWVHQPTAGFAAPSGFPNVIHFWNANEGFCQGDPNGGYLELYTTTDGGTTWTRVPQANIPPIVASDEYGTTGYIAVQGNTVWFTTSKGRVFKSTNKGLNWTVASTPITASQLRISFANQNLGLIQENVSPYRVCRSTDGGATWNLLTYSGLMFNNDFCHVPGTLSTFVSTGADLTNQMAGVSYSTDGGSTWTVFPGTDTSQFLNVAFANPRHAWSGAFSQNASTGGMWKYSGNLFSTDPCAGLQSAFSASATKIDLVNSGLVNFTDQSTGAPTAWQWSFGDGASSTQQNPSHTYSAIGNFTVRLSITKGSCIDSSMMVITVVNTTGLNEVSGNSLSVYPNITSDNFSVYHSSGNCNIRVFDMSGRKFLEVNGRGEEIKTDVSELPQGLYLVRLQDDSEKVSVKKLVIAR